MIIVALCLAIIAVAKSGRNPVYVILDITIHHDPRKLYELILWPILAIFNISFGLMKHRYDSSVDSDDLLHLSELYKRDFFAMMDRSSVSNDPVSILRNILR